MATIHQFDNNPEEDEFYLVEIYWFITYTLVEPSINQQFIQANSNTYFQKLKQKHSKLKFLPTKRQKIL